ncbi:phosphoglycerate mutase [Massariosphaeria phaeospora]|uniref:Phosphoglycerate mutase n=1 Tax=Massariosphaeria phaeospora TaxID=100035 RepID=A0A7C8MEX1_9PLEO|nr:phosphoglycerate mutase [Massariosphaeria phaeospora]
MADSSTAFPIPEPDRAFHFKYSTVAGYFQQSDDSTDSDTFDFTKENFGLVDRKYETDDDDKDKDKTQWQRFETYVRHLNAHSAEDVQYKVLFLGRHGQGWHNVAEAKYGMKAWDSYYSMLDGADGMTWSDAKLTPTGQQQAKDVHALWQRLLPSGIPAPETYYVSPLTRTLETADLSFAGLDLPADKPYKPIVKELLREALGIHTCDRRSPASTILTAFPHVTLEAGFSDADTLWRPDYREPRSARKYRLQQLLDDVFGSDSDPGVFLALTSHSGAIASVLEAVGHRAFGLRTGGWCRCWRWRRRRLGGE